LTEAAQPKTGDDPLVLENVSLTLPSAAGPVEILRGLDVRVARNPALNQGDAIHPNARGVQLIADKLAPVVARELKKRS
jgi:hypothetical protein